MDYYLAKKRFGEEEHDLREWVTPNVAKVQEYASMLWLPDRDAFILSCFAWVGGSFAYAETDLHLMKAYVAPYRVWGSYRAIDFWNFPAETIALYEEGLKRRKTPICNCEDGTFLLASLLLAYTDGVYANLGLLGEWGHAWVSVIRDGQEYILETTLRGDAIARLLSTNPWLPAAAEPGYLPLYKFDHQNVVEITS